MSHPLVPMRKLRQLDVTVKSLSKIDFDFHGTMHIATEIGEVKFDFNGEGETKPGDFYQKIELTPADTYREITFRAVNEAGLAVGESTFDLSLLHQNNDLSYKGKLKLVPEGMLKIAILGHDTVGDGAKESTVIQSDIHRLFLPDSRTGNSLLVGLDPGLRVEDILGTIKWSQIDKFSSSSTRVPPPNSNSPWPEAPASYPNRQERVYHLRRDQQKPVEAGLPVIPTPRSRSVKTRQKQQSARQKQQPAPPVQPLKRQPAPPVQPLKRQPAPPVQPLKRQPAPPVQPLKQQSAPLPYNALEHEKFTRKQRSAPPARPNYGLHPTPTPRAQASSKRKLRMEVAQQLLDILELET